MYSNIAILSIDSRGTMFFLPAYEVCEEAAAIFVVHLMHRVVKFMASVSRCFRVNTNWVL